MTLFAMAGKIAPKPCSPLRRSVTQDTAHSIARWRNGLGNRGAAKRSTASTPRKNQNQAAFCCGALGASPIVCGGCLKKPALTTTLLVDAPGRTATHTKKGAVTL